MNLESKIKLLPKDILSVIKKAGSLADSMDVHAYLVGGFVRDMLLRRPNLDLDIVIEARHREVEQARHREVGQAHHSEGVQMDGILFAEKLAEVLGARLIKHKRFGTAVLTLPNHKKIDIATARKETYARPGALPVVSGGSIYDDLLRRDFSINAMAVTISKHNFGKLSDYFSGIADLKRKRIRVLHSLSFADDPTRMLRAIRFGERYGFSLERKTLQLFKAARKEDALNKVTKHRLRDELILMLKEDRPLKVISSIRKLYGFSFIDTGIRLSGVKLDFLRKLNKAVMIFRKHHPKKRVLDSWLIFLIGLLDGLDLEAVKKICADFAFARGDTKRIVSYFDSHSEVIKRLSEKNIRPSSVYHLLEPLSFEVIVLIMAKQNKSDIIKKINEYLFVHNGIRLAVDGSDLKELGFVPGPHFKEMLVKALYAKIDKVVKDKNEEIKFIKEHGSRHIKT
ncbi:MAG: CCA tRNA nucleotidyltransferase [Candidatus Omnitrophota bacterium]|nr:CCA tRNA nucleotidyltransferase [Candidatus Omnitrophota bacterium]